MSSIQDALNRTPMSRAQILAVATTAMLSALDGFDVLAITFAAPGIAESWSINKTALGITLSSGLLGMATGSLLLAPFGDRIGRQRVAIICLVLMFVGMLMSAFAQNVVQMACWRIATGIGIGAMVPIIAPLAAEYSNDAQRRLAMAVMSVGYPIGGTLGGFAAAVLLNYFAWPAIFLFGAGLTLVMMVPTLLWLHEPPAFLISRRPSRALVRLNAYLQHCGQPPVDALPTVPESASNRRSYVSIFSGEHRRGTILMTLANLLFIMTVYYILSWMPQLVADLGHTPSFATSVSSTAALAGVVAGVVVGMVGKRIPLDKLAAGLMAGLSITVILFGFTGASAVALLGMGALVGAFLYSGIVVLYSAIVDTFSSDVRTTGVGFVMGVGRGGAAIAPALAGFLFAVGAGREVVTVSLASGALIAGALILFNPRRYSI